MASFAERAKRLLDPFDFLTQPSTFPNAIGPKLVVPHAFGMFEPSPNEIPEHESARYVRLDPLAGSAASGMTPVAWLATGLILRDGLC